MRKIVEKTFENDYTVRKIFLKQFTIFLTFTNIFTNIY